MVSTKKLKTLFPILQGFVRQRKIAWLWKDNHNLWCASFYAPARDYETILAVTLDNIRVVERVSNMNFSKDV